MKQTLSVPHQLTRNVKLLHKVALVWQDQVLILKRADRAKSRPGKWDLAGGNSEWPHQLKESQLNVHQPDVAREILEETGIKVDSKLFSLDNLVYFATFFNPSKQVYSINCGWQVYLKQLNLKNQAWDANSQPDVTISKEHSDFKWIRLKDLDQYDFGGPERDFETKIIRKVLS